MCTSLPELDDPEEQLCDERPESTEQLGVKLRFRDRDKPLVADLFLSDCVDLLESEEPGRRDDCERE